MNKSKSDLSVIKKDENPIQQQQSLKEIVLEWGSSSSAHGFPGIFSKNTNWFIKLVWLSLMLGSWSYCFYTIVTTMVKYYDYQADTKIQYINEIPARYPQIDICNLSPYKDTQDNLIPFKNITNAFTKAKAYIKERLLFEKEKTIGNPAYFENKTQKWNEMFMSCKFNGKNCFDYDFDYYENFYYGKCYRFNGPKDKNRTISKSGTNFGLEIEISTGLNKNLTVSSGFKILINNQSFNSFPEENGIDITHGHQTNIAISRTFNEKLSWPYNDCLDNFQESKYNYLIEKSKTLKQMKQNAKDDEQQEYDPNLCFKMCYQKYFIDECNCTLMDLPKYNINGDPESCYSIGKMNCSNENDEKFFSTSAVDDCISQCPTRCSEFLYDTKLSFSTYPSEWFSTYCLKNNFSIIGDYLKTVALVNIYFNEMSYMHVYQEPSISIDSLFGTIGGQLGKLER